MRLKRDDHYFMGLALRLARQAAAGGEVPIGAVVVHGGRPVGRGWNQVETQKDASRHAELIALSQASQKLGRWRLTGCTLYTTLEPCAMCAGALVLSRIDRLVIGTADPKAGACGTVFNIVGEGRLNHRIKVDRGIMADESSELLKVFFRGRRPQKS